MGFFGRLLGSSTTSQKNTPTIRTSVATTQRIQNLLGIRQLESMPAQAARAFQLASDPNAQVGDFVKVIEADEVISARIIRIANSVYFFRGSPANDIEKAVANIGLDELRCLISATMLRSLLQGKLPAREQIWANGVATGICARLLSRHTNICDGEAFLCGLLHDVGKLVMIRRGSAEYDKVIRKVASEEKTFCDAEEEIFQTTHVEVGKWVAEVWNFPLTAIRAVAGHHEAWAQNPANMGKGTSPAMLVKAADTIAHAAGVGHPASFGPVRERAIAELPNACRQLGMSTKDGQTFIESFGRHFEQEYGRYRLEEFQH